MKIEVGYYRKKPIALYFDPDNDEEKLVLYGKVYSKYGDCPVHLDPNAEPDGL